MENTKHPVAWFELPSVDFRRAVGFFDAILESRLKVEKFGAAATASGCMR